MKKILILCVVCLSVFALKAQVIQPSYINQYTEYDAATQSVNDIIIQSGAELVVTGILRVSDNASIIVNPGGKLTVDGGTITSMGANRMWKGIIVLGQNGLPQSTTYQGYVEMKNNAVIENAVKAVQLWNGSNSNTAGGVIHAQRTTFRNNQQAVEFGPYKQLLWGSITDPVLARSNFRGCTFTINNSHYLTANGLSFSRHVYIHNTSDISFFGCKFKNETTTYGNTSSLRGKAIYAYDSHFTVSGYCEEGGIFIQDPIFDETVTAITDPIEIDDIFVPVLLCPRGYIYITTSFSGFYYAVDVNSTSSNTSHFSILDASFTSNYRGIWAAGVQGGIVRGCSFNASFAGAVRGIYLSGCKDYKIERNYFYGLSTSAITSQSCYGIYVTGSGTGNNVLYRNSFDKMAYGIYVTGTNGDNVIGGNGLLFQCNTFKNSRYGIYIADNAVVRNNQGGQNAGADNKFTGNVTADIRANTQNYLLYYFSTGNTQHDPVLTIGNVFKNNNATAANCSASSYTTTSAMESVAGTEQRNAMQQEEAKQKISVDVYPNPVTQNITVAFSEYIDNPVQAQFFDMTGRCVHTETITGQKSHIDLSRLSPGMYFYQLTSGERIIARSKIVKE